MVIEGISDPKNRVIKINNVSFVQMKYFDERMIIRIIRITKWMVEDNCHYMIIIWWRRSMMNGWKESQDRSKVLQILDYIILNFLHDSVEPLPLELEMRSSTVTCSGSSHFGLSIDYPSYQYWSTRLALLYTGSHCVYSLRVIVIQT